MAFEVFCFFFSFYQFFTSLNNQIDFFVCARDNSVIFVNSFKEGILWKNLIEGQGMRCPISFLF